jgi:hypothetical protein
MCGLISPILFVLLLRPVLEHHANVCSAPSVVARALIALTFLVAAGLVIIGIERVGIQLMLAAVALNVAMILWFFVASRFRLTPELMGWAYQDCLAVLLIGSLHYSAATSKGTA